MCCNYRQWSRVGPDLHNVGLKKVLCLCLSLFFLFLFLPEILKKIKNLFFFLNCWRMKYASVDESMPGPAIDACSYFIAVWATTIQPSV